MLHEQNAVPGVANRLAARTARTVALGAADAAPAFAVPIERTVVVGNPVRPELARLDRAALREQGLAAFDLDPARRTLLVFGGSHGAGRINDALIAATPHWPQPGAVQVLHACGRDLEDDARAAWAAADLALTRAGASTIAELTAAGVPAVIVPLPRATASHQAANARAVAAAGAAIVIDDRDLARPSLAATAARLLDDSEQLAAMAGAMRGLGRPAAAEQLAALVLEAAGRS